VAPRAKPIVGLGDLLVKYTTVVASGVVAFGTTLVASTWAQKLVGLSTGSLRPLPTLAGAVRVGLCRRLSHRQRGGGRRPSPGTTLSRPGPQDTSRTVVSLGHIRCCKIGWLGDQVELWEKYVKLLNKSDEKWQTA
jgi:hypothetical protein